MIPRPSKPVQTDGPLKMARAANTPARLVLFLLKGASQFDGTIIIASEDLEAHIEHVRNAIFVRQFEDAGNLRNKIARNIARVLKEFNLYCRLF